MAKKAEIEQTEIEAPYELPDGWKWERLGNYITLLRGVSYKKDDAHSEKLENDCLIMRGGNIVEGSINLKSDNVYVDKSLVSNNQLIQKYDIIIVTSTGSSKVIGRAGVSKENYNDVAFGAFLTLARPNDFANKSYINHYFQSSLYRERIRQLASGVNINNIRSEYITETPFPLPPTLAEQQRIVNRIETMFAKLDQAQEKAQAVLDSFETRKAAILHKAFTGELTAKWRKENGVSDESWEEKRLGEICSEIKIGPFGSLLHEDDYIENGIPLVNPKHIFNQAIKPDTKVSISNEKADELKSYRLLKNDIVLGRRGEMGRCAPVSENENGWLCGTGSMILRLKPEYQARIYSILISSHNSVLYFEENAVGSTLKNLNEKIVKNLPMPIISLPEQKEIVRILDTVLEKESRAKEAAQTVLDQIALLKKSILARAFRGEL